MVNFEQISHLVLVFLLLTLNKWLTAVYVLENLYLGQWEAFLSFLFLR